MTRLFGELGFALLFARLTGDFSLGMAALGLLVAWLLEALWRGLRTGGLNGAAAWRGVRFGADFLRDLVASNLVLAWDVLTPKDRHHIQMAEVPLEGLSEGEKTLLCHRITLTPGTLACALNEERTRLLVHVMYPDKGRDMGRVLRRPLDILRGEA